MVGFRIPVTLAALAALFTAAGCSSSSNPEQADASAPGDGGNLDACEPIDSQCGQPCVGGNSLGVGAYCSGILDCSNLPQAHICSDLGDSRTHFCTFVCQVLPDGGSGEAGASDAGGSSLPTDCGEGASCTCGSTGECGCTPNACLGP